MPFRSKRQQRAAFGGHIPGISKTKAREWAHETRSIKSLPNRVASEKGKPTLFTLRKRGKLKTSSIGSALLKRVASKGSAKAVGGRVLHADVEDGPGRRSLSAREKYQRDVYKVWVSQGRPKFSALNPETLLGFGKLAAKFFGVTNPRGRTGGDAMINLSKKPGPPRTVGAIRPNLSAVSAMTKLRP
jgi:hypothetical protein